ncbi:beta-galactosidase [Companilactobacillus sp. HBUAS56257]|uniref:beta-galactosidase n=1 Tax=Companilactobacillus sp. HBUAS56257 TaxID=3109360 RepID=UPI002FEED17F
MDKFLYGGDYNPEQWLDQPEILKQDLELMKRAKINTVTLGTFSWASIEPHEGEYHFEWLDKIFDDIYQMGGHVILATPSGGRPQWMSQKYPEVNQVDEYGRRHTHGFRQNHCYSSPIYRRETQKINTMLAKRYGKHPALLMWHVSNEFGGQCFCDLCQENWRKWLQNKYQTLDNLNKAWYLRVWSGMYSDWSQVLPPNPLGETKVHGMDLDWKRFVTAMTIDFYESECKPLREITPDIPITTNFMAEGLDKGDYYPITGLNYSQFAKHVDVVSWDSYPAWHNDYETLAETAMKSAYTHDCFYSLKHKPFLIMESTPSCINSQQYNKAKRPGMNILSSFQQIAHGSDSTLYFQIRQAQGNSEKFHGGVIGHDGSSENRVYQEVAQYGSKLESIAEIRGAIKKPKVGIYYDWESNWAFNRGGAFGRPTRLGIQTLQKHYSVFWGQDIACEIVNGEDDFTKYDLIIAPIMYMYRDDTVMKLQKFVKAGGTLVGSYFTGMADEYDRVILNGLPTKLRELFGIKTKEIDTLYPKQHNHVEFGDKSYVTKDYNQVIETTTAKVLAKYQDDFYQGTPAVVKNEFGQGTTYYLATRLGRDFLKEFYRPIIEKLHLANDFVLDPKYEVSCQVRIKNGVKYYFLMNFSEDQQVVHTRCESINVEDGSTVGTEIHLEKYGCLVLKLNE